MTQIAAPAEAQVKAKSCTGALSLNAEIGMIPFLIVEAVLAPTARAPVISNARQRSIACRYVTERDDTLVAHALATSSVKQNLSVAIRSTLLPRLALQVHSSHLKRSHLAQLPLPEL